MLHANTPDLMNLLTAEPTDLYLLDIGFLQKKKEMLETRALRILEELIDKRIEISNRSITAILNIIIGIFGRI